MTSPIDDVALAQAWLDGKRLDDYYCGDIQAREHVRNLLAEVRRLNEVVRCTELLLTDREGRRASTNDLTRHATIGSVS